MHEAKSSGRNGGGVLHAIQNKEEVKVIYTPNHNRSGRTKSNQITTDRSYQIHNQTPDFLKVLGGG